MKMRISEVMSFYWKSQPSKCIYLVELQRVIRNNKTEEKYHKERGKNNQL